MVKYSIAVIDADYLIYHAAWASKEFPFEAHVILRNKLKELLDALYKQSEYAIIAASSKDAEYVRTTAYAEFGVYKGNRKDTIEVAEMKTELRASLMEHCISVPGYEADDILYSAELAYGDTLMVSTDKDLLNIPGAHYNPKDRNIVLIDEQQALESFWLQMLTGDRVDNIQGIPKIGPVKGKALVRHCLTEEEYRAVVQDQYSIFYGATEGKRAFDATYAALRMYDIRDKVTLQPTRIEDLLSKF